MSSGWRNIPLISGQRYIVICDFIYKDAHFSKDDIVIFDDSYYSRYENLTVIKFTKSDKATELILYHDDDNEMKFDWLEKLVSYEKR